MYSKSGFQTEVAEQNERDLDKQVSALLLEMSQLALASGGDRHLTHQHLEAAAFARTHGIGLRFAEDGPCPQTPAEDEETLAAMRSCLAHARELIRRLDSERRHHYSTSERQKAKVDVVEEERGSLLQRTAASHRRSLQLESRLTAAVQRAKAAEAALDARGQELLQLRRFVRSLPPAYAEGCQAMLDGEVSYGALVGSLQLVPDRRFEEAFKDKMDVIALKRRFARARQLHQETSQQLEQLQMEVEDGRHALSAVVATPAAAADETALSASVSVASSPAFPLTGAVLGRAPSALDFPLQLPFSTATPQDAHLKSLIYASRYGAPLTEARESILRQLAKLKTTEDSGLYGLRSLLVDTTRRLPPAERPAVLRAFDRQTEALLRAHRDGLFALVGLTNQLVRAVTGKEQAVHQTTKVATRSVGCLAVDTSAEDYRLHCLTTEMQQQRLKALEQQAAAQQQQDRLSGELAAARHQTLEVLHQLQKLGEALVGQARRAGGEGLEDPFQAGALPQKERDLDDPRLLAKVEDAVQLAVLCTQSHMRGLRRVSEEEEATTAATAATGPHGGRKGRGRTTSRKGSTKPPMGAAVPRGRSGGARRGSAPVVPTATLLGRAAGKTDGTKAPAAPGGRHHSLPELAPQPPTAADGAAPPPRRSLAASLTLGSLNADELADLPEAAQTTREEPLLLLSQRSPPAPPTLGAQTAAKGPLLPMSVNGLVAGGAKGKPPAVPAADNNKSGASMSIVQLSFKK